MCKLFSLNEASLPAKSLPPFLSRAVHVVFLTLLVGATGLLRTTEVQGKVRDNKPNPCGSAISKCGCTITASGLYQITKDLSNSGALNAADNSCIAVAAPKVSLFLNGYGITNDGPENGIGIHLTPLATASFVSGASLAGTNSMVSGWDVGIEDEASNVTVSNFVSEDNNCEGVLVVRASNVSITNFVSTANGSAGIWFDAVVSGQAINGTIGPTVSGSESSQNNNYAGILVSGTNPLGVPGACALPKSSNRASSDLFFFANTIENNTGTGILVQANVRRAIISANTSLNNTAGDLTDENDFCGSDVWYSNTADPDQEFPCVP